MQPAKRSETFGIAYTFLQYGRIAFEISYLYLLENPYPL